jgi:probable rRNA maturation factor
MTPSSTTRAPRHQVEVHRDGVRSPVAVARLGDLVRFVLRAERVPRAHFSLTLLGPAAMARLNRTHLGHRGATDVITFALGDDGTGTLTADIYVCPDVARAQARAWGVGVREEVQRLVVHAVLHACGWDHPVDDQRERSPMWRRQERLLTRWLASDSGRA